MTFDCASLPPRYETPWPTPRVFCKALVLLTLLLTVATWLPILAIGLAFATFIATQVDMRRRAKSDYTEQLEHRMQQCEKSRAEQDVLITRQTDQIRELRDENFDLMKRVLRLENGKS